jgi:hypothetical protein
MCSNFQLWQSLQKVHVFVVVVAAANNNNNNIQSNLLKFWHCATSLGYSSQFVCLFVGPCCHRTMALDPTFGSFTLLELISLVKESVYRLEQMFFWCVGTVRRCTTSYFIGRASVFVTPSFFRLVKIMCKISYFCFFLFAEQECVWVGGSS